MVRVASPDELRSWTPTNGVQKIDQLDLLSNEHEETVISSLLAGHPAMHEITSRVSTSDFSQTVHQRIFARIADMSDQRIPLTPSVVEAEMLQAGIVDDLGGREVLQRLIRNGSFHNQRGGVEYHADQVRKFAAKRRLRSILTIAIDQANGSADDSDIIANLESELIGMRSGVSAIEFVSAGQAAKRALDDVVQAYAGQKSPGLKTGLKDLDKAIGGLQKKTMIVLAARPSIGKSCVGAEIAQRVAESGHSVMFANLEMSVEEMGQRFLSRLSGVPSQMFRDPDDLTNELIQRLYDSQKRIESVPLYLWGKSGESMVQLRAAAKRYQAKHGLDLLVVDYMGLLSGPEKTIYERVTAVSKQLKRLAQELDVPVIVLCQLNRESEKGNRRPTLADLRDSGQIEQDADQIWLLIRERDSESAILNIAKFRNGSIQDVALRFDGAHSRVQDQQLGEEWKG
jgi:replicative DNA helicase